MFKPRYEIQICWPNGQGFRKCNAKWDHYYSSPTFRLLRNARKAAESLNNKTWDFALDEPAFRIYDRVEKKVVQ